MAEQEWVRPEMPVEAAGPLAERSPASGFSLRPLSLGELLDRIFTLYRSRFALFAGITMFAAAVQVLCQAVAITLMQSVGRAAAVPPTAADPFRQLRVMGGPLATTYAVFFVFYLVSSITQAGTALAVTRVYLGRATSVKSALLKILPAWYRWIAIALWQIGSMLWLPLVLLIPAGVLIGVGAAQHSAVLAGLGAVVAALAVLAGFPIGVIFYLRNALAIPAAVMEGLKTRAAMRRSKDLAAGAKGRIFVVMLIAFGLLEVIGVLELPLSMLMMARPQQQHYLARGIEMLITFAGHTIVAPVLLIGLTLVYFDQRVRKEAFDLEIMLETARGSSQSLPMTDGTAPSAEPATVPEGYAPLP